MRPIPIFQLNPRGRIAGSTVRPRAPARLSSIGGATPSLSGRCASAHSNTEIPRMTVPARRRKTLVRSSNLRPSPAGVGQRYGGISSTKEADSLFRIELFRIRAVANAAAKPSAYRASNAAARVPSRAPASGRSGMKAAMISVYTGSLAEQVISGATRMVAKRSRLFSIVRVAMMAGTAQAYADSRGMKLLPCKPTRAIVRSAMIAARARYPESSSTPINRNRSRI